MNYTEKRIKNLNGYNGLIVNVRLDEVRLPGGAECLREVVEHPGGVTIMAIDEENYVYCVRQYRYPMEETLLEIPAGKLEPGEDPLNCAVRELSEETGITAERVASLGAIYPSPGFCREVLYLYIAQGLSYGQAHPDENELLSVERVHLDELVDQVMGGQIKDAKTVVTVLKAKRFLEDN